MPIGYQFKYELRHLRTFLVIADLLSFRKAAEQLHIAQPALTRQIQQLEEALDCILFDRKKRSIKLTEAGQNFYEKLPLLFDQLEALTEQTRKIASGEISALRIGFSGAAMSSFLPSIIKEMRKSLEHCEFDFVEKTSDQQILDIKNDKLDAAFILFHPDDSELNVIPIRPEKIGLVLPEDHPLTAKKTVSLKALEKEKIILFPRHMNPVMYDEIIAHCHKAGFSPNVVREAAPRANAVCLVAANEGIATIAESYAHSCVQGTTYRPIKQPGPMIRFSCVVKAERDEEWLRVLKNIIKNKLS